MSDKLPFVNSTGLVQKILDKIIEAQTPPCYTTDFQSTVLGYGSGSARPFIPLLKRIGFLSSDGTPTDLYNEFRTESQRGSAMAKAIRKGYDPLYRANEYAHKLSKEKLRDAIILTTGGSKADITVNSIVATFEALKTYADFDVDGESLESDIDKSEVPIASVSDEIPNAESIAREDMGPTQARGMNLSYTINLNLPASKDPEVFNAIFKSLKENLLG